MEQVSYIPNYNWYQSRCFIVVDIFVKNVVKDGLNITCDEQRLTVCVNDVNEQRKYLLDLGLWSKIVPSSTSFKIFSTKIEVKLQKCYSDVQWANLQKPLVDCDVDNDDDDYEEDEGNEEDAFIPNHTWYQSQSYVVVDIFLKNVTKQDLKIVFKRDSVRVRASAIVNNEYKLYTLMLNLSEKIKASSCTYKIFSTKVELRLRKYHSGLFWQGLERDSKLAANSSCMFKNWDDLPKLYEDPNENKSIEDVFRRIYADGDDGVRRTMEKYFYESNAATLGFKWD